MAPPFSSNARAAGFGALLLFFLTLPVTLHWIGGVSKDQHYRGISERAGAIDYIRRQIFEEPSELDIAFIGSSLMRHCVNPEYVQRELSRALGRKATSIMLAHSWQGPDLAYFISRDLLEQRKVKMLAIPSPARVHRSNQPHVQLFRVARFGDHPGALNGLGIRLRLAIYADYVLGGPRQALNLLRPNLVDPHAGRSMEFGQRFGFQDRPFVRRVSPPPAIEPSSIIYSAQNRDPFRFGNPALNELQLHFLRKTSELARQYGVPLVILHTPSPSEQDMDIVPDRRPTPEVLGDGVYFIGVPSTRLFANVPPAHFEDYFRDEHMNLNGMELYTTAITPALIEIYERHQRRR
jgi:hypothetical protein